MENKKLNTPEKGKQYYSVEVTKMLNGGMAPAGKIHLVVRMYAKEPRWRQKKADKWQAHVTCSPKDIDSPEKMDVISGHVFKQLQDKYEAIRVHMAHDGLKQF